MNFKSLLVFGLSVATLGLSVPAHAQSDNANIIKNVQTSETEGYDNTTRLKNETSIRNGQSGRRGLGSNGTTVDSDQFSSTKGEGNRTRIDNSTKVDNLQRRTPR
jgi:hypothetical protein